MMLVLRILRFFIDHYARLVTIAACAALFVAMVHVVADALSSRFLGRPIEGTFQIVTLYYMVALFFLPLGLTEKLDAHISADLLHALLPVWLQRLMTFLAQLAMAGFAGVLAWQAVEIALRQTRIGAFEDTASFHLLIWPSRWIAVVGLVAFTLVAALKAVDLLFSRSSEARDE